VVERYSRLWTGLGGWGFQRALLLPDASTAPVALDLFGVNHVLSPARGAGGGLPGPLVFNGQGGPVVLNSDTLPRAYAAYGWHRATDLSSGVAAIASRGAQQVRDAPLVEGLPSRRSERPATPARVVRETPAEISVRVRAEREALLVLGDNYYPGWRAYVNGRERKIHPANVAFRAVRVPPGEHLVRFAYEPGSVRLGLLLTGLGVVITIGIAVGMLLRRRRRS
jgi:hypothetical protein